MAGLPRPRSVALGRSIAIPRDHREPRDQACPPRALKSQPLPAQLSLPGLRNYPSQSNRRLISSSSRTRPGSALESNQNRQWTTAKWGWKSFARFTIGLAAFSVTGACLRPSLNSQARRGIARTCPDESPPSAPAVQLAPARRNPKHILPRRVTAIPATAPSAITPSAPPSSRSSFTGTTRAKLGWITRSAAAPSIATPTPPGFSLAASATCASPLGTWSRRP